ncbi:unnamed protein product [Urochloa decumbens]|uniref:Uncharacterized protein n=1 Tax=Urochloa decumbens TaxID=240449 RepID=A0ABC9D5A0_9POAL
MRKEIIIRMQPDSDKGCRSNKALKVAASVSVGDRGRQRQGPAAGDRRRRGRGRADQEAEEGGRGRRHRRAADPAAAAGRGHGHSRHAAPYQRWPGEQSRKAVIGYYHRTPSPGYYQPYAPSPVAAAHGGYGYGYAGGSLYARDVARSHPANYSPMIARHDLRVVGRAAQTAAAAAGGEGRDQHGGGGPNCCSIL